MLRIRRERKLDNEKYKIRLGIIDATNPMAVYLDISCFILPEYIEESYGNKINNVEKWYKRELAKTVSECGVFTNTIINNFEVSIRGMKAGKKSYFFVESIFRQNDEMNPLGINDLTAKIRPFILSFCTSLKDKFEESGFSVSKKK